MLFDSQFTLKIILNMQNLLTIEPAYNCISCINFNDISWKLNTGTNQKNFFVSLEKFQEKN